MFLLVSCSFAFQYLLCFVQGQGQRTKDKEQKHVTCRVSLTTISDNNIGQWLPFPPYPLPNVVLQVQKNIERKVDINVATLKEGKRGRAFF